MPTFYFHVQTVDGVVEEDTVGAEFDTEEQAIKEARDYARGLMREAAEHEGTIEHVIEVADAEGHILIRLLYRATLQVEHPRAN